MVFGLSSSKPKWLTSDHLPSRAIYHNRQRRKENRGLNGMASAITEELTTNEHQWTLMRRKQFVFIRVH